jgi:hypothetical protein
MTVITERLKTALWLMNKRPGLRKRLGLYLKFRAENREWGQSFDWGNRIRDAVASPDNAFIPRVAKAGAVDNGELVMHNGLRVHELSYDGEGPRDLMRANRGVHEPQEERLFMEVLKCVPPGASMLELGSYWAFYSMWFYKEIANAHCFCVEPESRNIQMGIDNFALNFGAAPPRVVFEQAFAGQCNKQQVGGVPTVCVDQFLNRYDIGRLAILHADTQGHELNVLLGAAKSLAESRIDYCFLSTHTNELHRRCLGFFRQHGYQVIADIDLLETYSFDGLIVAMSPNASRSAPCELSLKGY